MRNTDPRTHPPRFAPRRCAPKHAPRLTFKAALDTLHKLLTAGAALAAILRVLL